MPYGSTGFATVPQLSCYESVLGLVELFHVPGISFHWIVFYATIWRPFVILGSKASCSIRMVLKSRWLLLKTSTTSLVKASFITKAKFGIKVQECSLTSIFWWPFDPVEPPRYVVSHYIVCVDSCSYDAHVQVSSPLPPHWQWGKWKSGKGHFTWMEEA